MREIADHLNDKDSTSRRNRWIILVTILMTGALVLGVYAATLFTVSNTATIQTGASLMGTGPVSSGTTCSGSTGTYTSSIPVNWGSVSTGTTVSQFICLENKGSGNYLVTFASTLPAGDGSISSPQSGMTIAPAGFMLVELDWQIAPNATLGSVSFNINFQ